VQLCAQALCLEEMIDVDIQKGALFYGRTKRRLEVEFDTALRSETENAAQQVHKMIASGTTPQPDYSAKCKSCSLLQVCMPESCSKKEKASRYLTRILKQLDAGFPNGRDKQSRHDRLKGDH
jgi:CRISPR-associated exonuclease Cas4